MMILLELILCVSVTISSLTSRVNAAQPDASMLRIDKSDIGIRLDGHTIIELDNNMKLRECGSQCRAITKCVSINFSRDLGLCQLNSANKSDVDDSQIVANTSFVHINIASWPKTPSDACSTKPCSDSEKCLTSGSSYICLSTDCGTPRPTLDEGSLVTSGSTILGSVRKYACPAKKMVQGNSEITCTGNAWTTPEFTCEYVSSCADLKACNSEYTDGEYWLYPTPYGGTPVRIYCKGLTTDTPQAYITVSPKENRAYYGAYTQSSRRTLDFTKIAVDTATMIVNRTDLTFARSTGTGTGGLWYGMGGECECESWCTPALGSFRIDTSTTGLITDPALTWQGFGWYGLTKNFYRSADNTVITANCGGHCGGCDTSGNMTLHLNPLFVVDPALATVPTCT